MWEREWEEEGTGFYMYYMLQRQSLCRGEGPGDISIRVRFGVGY